MKRSMSNGNAGQTYGGGPGMVKDWRLRKLQEAQVSFWRLVNG